MFPGIQGIHPIIGVSSPGGGGAATPQPSFANTRLLLGMNGADTSTTFTDESSVLNGNANVAGDAQVDTAFPKFGTGALLLDGTGDWISYNDSGNWDLGGTGNPWTWEMWIRFDASVNLATAQMSLASHYNATSNNRAFDWCYDGPAGGLRFVLSNDGTSSFALDTTAPWSPSVSTFYHVAICRTGSSFRQFVDGVQIGTTATSTAGDNASTAPLRIGAREAGGSSVQLFKGHIDEVRFTKEAIYIANFTPPSAAHPRS